MIRVRRNHKWKRSALPSDRHQRACAARHIPYVRVNQAKPVSEIESIVELQPVVQQETKVKKETAPFLRKKEKKEKKTGLLHRYNRNVQASRNAEIDALVNRKKHRPFDLLIRPYSCMKAEAEQELPSSLLSSIARLLVKWIVAAVIIAMYFASLVNHFNFSILRVSFTSGAETAMRMCLVFAGCEMLTYIGIAILSRFTKKPLSFARVFAAGTMGVVAETAGFVLAGLAGLFNPLLALAMLLGTIFFGTILRSMAIARCGALREETVAIVAALCGLVSIGLVFLFFNLGETALIKLLLEIYY